MTDQTVILDIEPELSMEENKMELIETNNIKYNTTFTHTLNGFGFDDLPQSELIDIFKDGRAFSYFIEPWLAMNYPLIHVTGCKDHDFIDANNNEIIFDEKTFTTRGCRFMPSSMIGTGRLFDQEKFEEKAKKMIYCIVSNINFPEIKIKFIPGTILIKTYPNGIIHIKEHNNLFSS